MVTYKVPSVTSQIHKDKKHGLLRNCISQEFPTNQNQISRTPEPTPTRQMTVTQVHNWEISMPSSYLWSNLNTEL